jgi:hypothetical protein
LDAEVARTERLTRELVERVLRKRDVMFLTDSDGDFKIEFGRDDDSGVPVVAWIMFSGKDGAVLQIRTHADREIPRDQWGAAISLCNEWNTERLWPKVYLRPADEAVPALLACELNLDLSTGTFVDQVERQLRVAISASFEFFEWLHKEKSFI